MEVVKKISNIIIFYDNFEDVIGYLNELSNQSISKNIYITIVMNKYSQDDKYKLEKKISDYNSNIEILYPADNLGYLNGLLYGYKNSKFDLKKMKWIIFSNTDISFNNNFLFSEFLNKRYDDDIFCIAPSVYNPISKSYSNPQYTVRHTKKSINRRIRIFKHPKIASLYLKLARYKDMTINKQKKESCFVYSAHGCFFFLNNKFLNSLDKDYMSLLYSEEAFIAEEIRLRNGRIYYEDSIEIYHNESQVTGKMKIKDRANHIAKSLERIRDEYFNE